MRVALKSPVVPLAFNLLEADVGVSVPFTQTKPLSVMAEPLSVTTVPERLALFALTSEDEIVLTTGVEANVVKLTTALYAVPAAFVAKAFT